MPDAALGYEVQLVRIWFMVSFSPSFSVWAKCRIRVIVLGRV